MCYQRELKSSLWSQRPLYRISRLRTTIWFYPFSTFLEATALLKIWWKPSQGFVIQPLSWVRLFVTPWTAARQASLSSAISRSVLKLMSIESVMPSNHLVLCWPLSPCFKSFPACRLFASGDQSIGVSASASVLSVNIQGWFPLGLTDLISLFSKGLSRVFSSTTVWKHQFFGAWLLNGPTLTSVLDYWKSHSFD